MNGNVITCPAYDPVIMKERFVCLVQTMNGSDSDLLSEGTDQFPSPTRSGLKRIIKCLNALHSET